jgi:hypothetical protein
MRHRDPHDDRPSRCAREPATPIATLEQRDPISIINDRRSRW